MIEPKRPAEKLTLAILLGGKHEGKGGEDEREGGLPPGFLGAVRDFRNAEDDETAAQALLEAIACCQEKDDWK